MIYNVAIDWTDRNGQTGTAVIPVNADSEETAIVEANAILASNVYPKKTRVISAAKAIQEKR